MAMNLPVLILHVSGANRDAEAARACELAGGAPHIVHINQLRAGAFSLSEYGMLILPVDSRMAMHWAPASGRPWICASFSKISYKSLSPPASPFWVSATVFKRS